MPVRSVSLVMLAGLASLLAIACTPDLYYPTMGDVKQIAEIGRQQLDAHDANMTRQHAVQTPESAAVLEAERARFERELAELGRKTDSLEAAHATLVRESIALAARVAALPEGLAQSISGTLLPKIEQTRESAQEARAEAARVESRADGAVAAVQRTEAEVRKVEGALASLAASLTERLESAGSQHEARMTALRAEVEAWRRSVAADLKLTPDQIEQMRGMTTEQIIALIAAALGSAGLGIVGSRTGHSRAEPRIERLEGKVGSLAEEVKLRTPVPA